MKSTITRRISHVNRGFIFMTFITALLLVGAAFFSPANAETKTFIREYEYQASEMDSKISSRVIAFQEVKRLLLEEIGTYLQSQTTKRKGSSLLLTLSNLRMDVQVNQEQARPLVSMQLNATVERLKLHRRTER